MSFCAQAATATSGAPCSSTRRAVLIFKRGQFGYRADEDMAAEPARVVLNELKRLQSVRGPPHPMETDTSWACLVEAVRVSAELFPALNKSCGDGDPNADAVPFALVLYEAMFPGHAHMIELAELRKAIECWVKSRPASRWSDLCSLASSHVASETMRRKWPSVRKSLHIDLFRLKQALMRRANPNDLRDLRFVPREGRGHYAFNPTDDDAVDWIALLVDSIRFRIALAPGKVSSVGRMRRSTMPNVELPESFVSEVRAQGIIPKVHRESRGRKPIPDATALRFIFLKVQTDVPWKALSRASTFHQRLCLWVSHGLQDDRLCALAVVHGVLSKAEADRFAALVVKMRRNTGPLHNTGRGALP